MTHRGPFQPLLFCDSVILYLEKNFPPPRYAGLGRGLVTLQQVVCLTRCYKPSGNLTLLFLKSEKISISV